MAVKERKQITGTTAQINAYEGHEGQIVWDKEKKTLVGMSGTAGKNYPLAPKEYVDNEVAKKASSAELTQGLAGKEDKGTCLPLTGGKLTGNKIKLKYGAEFYQSDSNAEYSYTIISTGVAGNTWEQSLYLANPNSADKGIVIIRSKNADKNFDLVLDSINSSATVGGVALTRVDSADIRSEGFIRFYDGLQICWGTVSIPSSGVSTKNFPRPFHTVPITVSQNQNMTANFVASRWNEGFQMKSTWNKNENNRCDYIAIGTWR